MKVPRQSLEHTDSQRSKFTSFIETASLQTLRLLRDRAKSLTLAAVVIGAVSVIGATLLFPDRGDLCTTTGFDNNSETAFLAENAAAMKTMMNAMAVKPTGNVDLDFVAMMVPHHQGAIDMAVAVLRHGRNQRLKRMAHEIIITQQQEIAAMHLAVGRPLPLSVPQTPQLPLRPYGPD